MTGLLSQRYWLVYTQGITVAVFFSIFAQWDKNIDIFLRSGTQIWTSKIYIWDFEKTKLKTYIKLTDFHFSPSFKKSERDSFFP